MRQRCAGVGKAAALRSRDLDDALDDGLDGLGVRLLVARVDRLHLLAAVAVDRDRFETVLPRFDVRLADVVHGGGLRKVDGLRNRARDERLNRAHHLDVAHVLDGTHPVLWLEGAIEDREVLVLHPRRAFDGAVLLDIGGDRPRFRLAVAKTA